MMNIRTTAIAVTALATLAGCGSRNDPDDVTPREVVSEVPERLIRDRSEYLAAWQAGDVDRTLGYFKDDAEVSLAPDQEMQGSTEIRAWLDDTFSVMSDFRIEQSTFEYDGNEVEEEGRYTIVIQPPGQAAMTEGGHYSLEWEYEGDRYLIQELEIDPD